MSGLFLGCLAGGDCPPARYFFKRGRASPQLMGKTPVFCALGTFRGALTYVSPAFFPGGMSVSEADFARGELKCRAGFTDVLMPGKESGALIGIGWIVKFVL